MRTELGEEEEVGAVRALTGKYGCSGKGTSNGISVSVKSVLSKRSSEPSSIACK